MIYLIIFGLIIYGLLAYVLFSLIKEHKRVK